MARTEDSYTAKAAELAGRTPAGAADPVEAALPEPVASVPVRDEPPALGIPRCIALGAANQLRPLLPQDPHRRRAVVLAVDNDVWVCGSLELAQQLQGTTTGSEGFYLPKGTPLVVQNKAASWVACTTTATGSRVSVLVEKDDQ